MATWYYNPHTGGNKIPPSTYDSIRKQVSAFANTRSWSSDTSLVLRFKGQFCYIDELKHGEEQAFPLCRLRYFNNQEWSLALFTYSNERYESCIFSNGKQTGTLEQAIEVSEVFIM